MLCHLSLVPNASMKWNDAGFVLNAVQECKEALCELKGQLCTIVCTYPLLLMTSHTDPYVLAAGTELFRWLTVWGCCGELAGPLATWHVGLEFLNCHQEHTPAAVS